MKSNKSFLGLFLAVLVLLPGCMHVPHYTRQPLMMDGDSGMYRATQEHINVEIKKCSNSDIFYLFDNRSDMLKYRRINVVYIAISNLSNNDYIITPYDISLAQVSYKDIDKSMKKTNSATRLIGGAASLTYASLAGRALVDPCIGAAGYVIFPLSLLMTVIGYIGIAKGIKSVVMNRRITKDLIEKTLHNRVLIKSGDHYEGLVFIKAADYNPEFTVTLRQKDAYKQSVTFDVDLEK